MSILLSQDVRTQRVSDAEAAGQTDITSDAVDCRSFDTVAFYVALGDVTAGGSGTLRAEQSDASDSGFAALDGASVAYGEDDDNGVLILEVSMPVKRYVRVVLERDDQDAAVDAIIAMQGRAATLPVEHDATVAASNLVQAPAEA